MEKLFTFTLTHTDCAECVRWKAMRQRVERSEKERANTAAPTSVLPGPVVRACITAFEQRKEAAADVPSRE